MHKTMNRQVLLSGLQVLTDSHYITTILCQIAEGLSDLLFCLTQSQHNTTFSSHAALFQGAYYFHTSPVFSLYAHTTSKAFYSFYIMRNHFRSGIYYPLYVVFFSFKIRN